MASKSFYGPTSTNQYNSQIKPQFDIKNATANYSNQVRPSTFKHDITTVEVCKFPKVPGNKTSFEARILDIKGVLYWGITKMWWNPESSRWCPSRKAVYLPAGTWVEFLDVLPQLSKALGIPLPWANPSYQPEEPPTKIPAVDYG